MKKERNKIIAAIAFLLVSAISLGQTKDSKKTTASLWDGMVAAGYLDKGAYLNFGGPAIKWTHQPVSILIGMLPSLRFKEDHTTGSAPKNAWVTPILGAGLGIVYKHMMLQVPVYYTPKTALANGKWNPGIGIGYKF